MCDKVNDDPEDGAKRAVSAVSKRLEMNYANVQLYALSLVLSLAQNCGSMMQRELASKSFTNLLLKLGQDKKVHVSVKSRIAELMETLTKEFKADPSLKNMGDALDQLKKKNPAIQPPEKPQKHQMTDLDRQKEEEELQMVLALSLSEHQNSQQQPQHSHEPQQHQPQQQPQAPHESQFQPPYEQQQAKQTQQPQQPQQQQPSSGEMAKPAGKTAASVTRVRALYDLNSTEEGELSFRKGDIIHVIESVYRDWWRGTLRGDIGIFPLNYVTPLPEPTAEELQREAQDELSVFAQSRNIEKLLAILSSADSRDGLRIAEDEQLQNLYHSTLAVRPKLVKLIDKYSQKKDDLIQLNDKFINARKAYDSLMENSLAQYRVGSPSAAHGPTPMPEPPYPVEHQPTANAPYPPYPQQRQSSTSSTHHQPSYPPQQQQSAQSSPYQQPVQSPYQQPAQSPYQQPSQPAQSPYQQPSQPAQSPYQQPSQPSYQQPSQSPYPQAPSQPTGSGYPQASYPPPSTQATASQVQTPTNPPKRFDDHTNEQPQAYFPQPPTTEPPLPPTAYGRT